MRLLFADTSAQVFAFRPSSPFLLFEQCGMRPVLVTVSGFDNSWHKLKHFINQHPIQLRRDLHYQIKYLARVIDLCVQLEKGTVVRWKDLHVGAR